MMLQFGTILGAKTNIKTIMMKTVNGKLHVYFNHYRTKVTVAVTQVRVKCLKNSGRQWTLWHLNAVR